MKWTHWRTMTSRLGLCTSHRRTMPSRHSSIRSLSWSISCFHSNLLLPKPNSRVSLLETLTLNCSQLRSSCPVLKILLLAPPPSWPQPREAPPGEPSSDQLAVYPHPAVHTTVLEHHTSLPAAAASMAPL